jgi:hypothetical protein
MAMTRSVWIAVQLGADLRLIAVQDHPRAMLRQKGRRVRDAGHHHGWAEISAHGVDGDD